MSRKRFIAGARCPKCHIEDRIVVYDNDNQSWLECVNCGYQQAQSIEAETPPDSKPKEIIVKWPKRKSKSSE